MYQKNKKAVSAAARRAMAKRVQRPARANETAAGGGRSSDGITQGRTRNTARNSCASHIQWGVAAREKALMLSEKEKYEALL
jgi:hypothetical protein